MRLLKYVSLIIIIQFLSNCDNLQVNTDDGLDSVRSALASVCNGVGVERAKPYEPNKSCSAPHRVVLMDEAGNEHEWSNKIPSSWRPTSVEDTELVLCVGSETKYISDTCSYNIGPKITAYSYYRMVTVREAKTGTILDQVKAGSVTKCPVRAPINQTQVEGRNSKFDDFLDRYSSFITVNSCEN